MPDKFLAGKYKENRLNILVHLQPLYAQRGNVLGLRTSQFKVLLNLPLCGRNLKGSFEIPILGVR